MISRKGCITEKHFARKAVGALIGGAAGAAVGSKVKNAKGKGHKKTGAIAGAVAGWQGAGAASKAVDCAKKRKKMCAGKKGPALEKCKARAC